MNPTRRPGLLRAARLFLALFTLQTVLATGPAWAQVTAAPGAPAGQKPLIDAAANGVPIVHIAPPSVGGVSRNQYQQFNVGGNGLILNNSTGNVLTQQGGWITGNLQIGLTPARIILNEVVGPDSSMLRGTIEVAGQRADIVIANPNGIRCDGCGFLNTAGRTSLVAGQVQFGEQGAIDAFQAGPGNIEVGAAGLNAAEQDRLDLIARGIVIEGEVWSRNLSVIAGRNHVLYGTLQATAQAGSASGGPLFAVDIKQLGGMYANQIYLLATEQGLGVNSTGRMAALQGNLVLSAQGDLSLHDSYAKGEVKVDAQGKVTLTGQAIAEADIRVSAPSGLANRGAVQAAGQLLIAAPRITNTGSLVQRGTGDFVIDAAQGFDNGGTVYAPGNVRIETPSLTGRGGQLLAGGNLAIDAASVGLVDQTIAADDRVSVSAGELSISASTLQSGSSLSLDSSGRLEVTGSSLSATTVATLTGREIFADGARISASGGIGVRATGIVSAQQAQLASNSSIELTGARIVADGASLSAQRLLDIRAGDDATLRGAKALAGQQIVIRAEGVTTAAAVVSAPVVSIEAGAGALDNAEGKLLATSDGERALQLSALGVNNAGGEIRANGGLVLNAGGGTLDNTGGVVAGQTGSLTGVASLINRRGVLYITSDLNLPSNGLDNSDGTIVSAGSLSITGAGQTIHNSGGILQAGESLTLNSGSGAIDSAGGTLVAGGAIAVLGGDVHLAGATVAAGGEANITASTLDAAASTIAANGSMELAVRRTAAMDGATVHSGGDLTVSAVAIQADGAQIASGAQLQVKAASVQGGTWSAAGDASISTTGTTDLSGGGLIAAGTATVQAEGINTSGGVVSGNKVSLDAGSGAVTNNGGTIVAQSTAQDALQVKGAGIDNTSGSLISAGGALLDARGLTLNNTDGTVQIAGVLEINAGELLNRGGTLSTASSITIQSQSVDNTGGTLATRGSLTIDTGGQVLDNTGGRLLAEGDIRVSAGDLGNSGGTIAANGSTTVQADTLDTSSGRISGTRALDVLVTQNITGNNAQFATEGALHITAGSADLRGATVQAGAALTIGVTGALDVSNIALDVSNTVISTVGTQAGALDISAQSINASQASIRGDAGVTVRALQGALAAGGAQIGAGASLTLQASDALTLDAARLQSNGDIQATSTSIDAAGLQAQTLNRLALNATTGPAVLNGAALIAGQTMDIAARGIAANGADLAAVGDVSLNAGTGALDANDIRVRSQTGGISVTASQVAAAASVPAVAGQDPERGFTAAGDLRITASTGGIDLTNAAAVAGGNLDLQGTGSLLTRGGLAMAGGNASLTGTVLDNDGGRIEAAGTLSVTVSEGVVNNSGGRIATPGLLTLQGANGAALTALSNRAGAIQTAGSLDLTLGSFDNREGSVLALGSLAVRGGSIDTRDGVLAARGDVQLDTSGGAFEGAGSRVVSEQGSISLQAAAVQLDAAVVQALNHVSVAGTQISAAGALISAQTGDLALSFGSGSATLDQVQLLAGGAIALQAGATSLEQARVAGGADVALAASGDLRLHGAAVDAQGALAITSGGALDASATLIAAAGAATLTADSGISLAASRLTATTITVDGGSGAIDNSAGSLRATGTASVRGTGLNNVGGEIAANGTITIQANVGDAQAAVDNTGGSIRSAQGSLSLRGGALRNAANANFGSGQIVAAQDVTLTAAGAVDNTGALIAAGGNLTLDATGDVSNRQGLIQAGGAVNLRSTALDNREGQILAGGGNISLTTTGLSGAGGIIAASGNLTLAASGGTVDVSASRLSSGGDMSLTGGATNITSVQLVAGGALSITGASLQAASADVQAAGALTLKAGSGALNAAGATLLSGQSIGLTGGAVSLRDAQVAANTSITVRGSGIDATGADIQAVSDVSVVASGTLNFAGARMIAGRDLEARGTGAGTSAGAQLLAGRDLSIGNGTYFDFNAVNFEYQYSRDLTVRAQGIGNADHEVFARNLTLDAGGGLNDNTAGTLNASGNLTLSGNGLSNQGGDVAANGTVNVQAGSGAVDNRSGAIYSTGGSVTLSGGAIDNRAGILTADGNLAVSGASLNNSGTQISAGGNLSVSLSGTLNNSDGVLAGVSVNADAGSVNNAAGVISGLDSVRVAGALNNDAGAVEAGSGGITIDTRGGQLVNTNSGSYRGIVSSGGIAIAAGAIDNQSGYIGASGALAISQSSSIDNRLGTLTGVGSVTLNSSGAVDNRAGSITSTGDVRITAGSLSNSGPSVVFAGHDLTVNAGTIDNSGTKDGSWKLGLLAGNDLSIAAGTIDNTNGAIVALGDATVRATTSLNNTGGQIAGNTVTLQAPSFTNTGGRVDAQQALTALVPQFSADGVLASSGSLTLQTTGDYTNNGTVAANNDLIVSTTGSYTNNGTVSAQRNLTLSAANLDNNAGAQIVSQSTTLDVTGTVNNAGLINSSAGTTTINATTVNNTGRIYGDAVTLNADVNNTGGAAIASRAGDIAIRGSLANTGLSDVVSLGNLSVQGNVTNENATIDVSGSMSVSGTLRNLNAGFTVETQTITEALNKLSIRPDYSTTSYDVAEMGWSNASPGYYVLPSTTYPIAQFGSERKDLSWTQGNCNGSGENFGCDLVATYSAGDPVWSLFNVASPGPAPTTTDPSGCMESYGETNSAQRSTSTECSAYWTAFDAYTAAATASYAELDTRISAFNEDLRLRTLIDWYERQITSSETLKPVVATSQPGLIRVGGNLTAGAGSLNQDSAIVAGGTAYVEDGATIASISNIATKATQTSTEAGLERKSWRDWHGGFSQSYTREYDLPQPVSDTLTKTVSLNTLTAPNRAVAGSTNTQAGSAPAALVPTPGSVSVGARNANPTDATPQGGTISGAGGQSVLVGTTTTAAADAVNGPAGLTVAGVSGATPTGATISTGSVTLDAAGDVPLAGSVIAAGVRAGQLPAIAAVRTSFAQQAAARPLVTVSAESIAPRQPGLALVKDAGYTTVTSTAPLQAPASQLFRLSTAPSARYLVETDPAFTGYRQFLSSEWMLTQLSLDPERNLKLYGDGFAEQRLIDDQIFALTGRRFLSGYASTEEEFQALMNAGVMYASSYQLTPGVALSAAQMAQLTTDIVWLEMQTVVLPDGSTAQAILPKVYLRRPQAGDLTPTGSIISASSIDLRSPSGDVTNSGTLYAWGDQGTVDIAAANVNNSGTFAANRIGVLASGNINQIGGEATGLGTGSIVSYQAGGNIVLQTTTQTSSQSLAGANGTTEVSRTNVDRIATIAAGSIVLAALGNIDMAGASVSASNHLYITATGTITAGAVQESYSIDIPLGGSLRGQTGGVAVDTVTNFGTSLTSGGNLSVNATGAVTMIGSTVNATGTVLITGQSVTLEAAKDFTSFEQSFVKSNSYTQVGRSDETLSGGIVSGGGNVVITAKDDITATGAVISSSDGLAALIAGGNVVVQNATTEHSLVNQSFSKSGGFFSKQSSLTESADRLTQVEGTLVQGASVLITAANNLTVTGSTVTAAGNVTLAAGNDVLIQSAQEVASGTYLHDENKSGFVGNLEGFGYGKSGLNQSEQFQATTQIGSLISGDNVSITAARDAIIAASALVADQNVNVTAGRNIELQTRDDTLQSQTEAQSSSTYVGLMPSGLTPRFTLFGQTTTNQDGSTTSRTAVESLLSANQGNLALNAGVDPQYKGTGEGNVIAQGGTLLAGGTVSASGNAVDMGTADSAGTMQSHFDSKSITLGAQLAGTIGSQITRVYDTVVESTQTDNDRLAGALALKGTYDAAKLASNWNGELAKADNMAAAAANEGVNDPSTSPFAVSVTLGTSKSSFDSSRGSTTQHGTVVQAANIQITATEGNVTGIGTKLYATGNVSLEAAGLVNLGAARNTSSVDQQSNSSSASIGVTFGFGQQNGISFQAGASQSEGSAQGSETTWDKALVTAGGTLSVKSGGDVNLIGAQLAGSTVKTDIGGKLNIETLQDTSNYQSEQSSSGWGVSLCIPPLCYGTSSVSVNSAQQSIDHSYQSATGQSGIAAGEGGFQISVAGTTNLIGGGITSQAERDMNTLVTAGVTYTDLTNTQNTSAGSSSFAFSSSGSAVSNLTGNVLGNLAGQVGLPESGSQSGSTLSVISPANITITGSDTQSQENVATLTSRDATTANGSLVNTLTLDQAQQLQEEIRKAQQDARAAQLIGAVIDNQIGDVAAQAGWAEDSWQKTALHGLSGAVQAAIGGGNIAAGAVSGALTAQIIPAMESYLVSQGYAQGSREFNELMEAGSTLAGAAIGAVVAGSSGAATGGAVANTSIVNNYLKHTEQVTRYSADQACRSGDQQACKTREALDALSQQRQNDMVQACVTGSADVCRTLVAVAGVDYYTMYLYGQELDKLISAATDPALVQQLKAIKAQNDIHMAQVANVIKTDLAEISENKGGLSTGEQNLLAGLYAAGTGQGASDALMGAGVISTGALRSTRLAIPVGGPSIGAGGPAGVIPTGFASFNIEGLPLGSRGVVDLATGEVKLLTVAGTLADIPATPIPSNIVATVVPQSSTNIKFGGSIQEQGLPFEDLLAARLPPDSRLPPGSRVFDFFDRETGMAISAKTLDTLTTAKLTEPSQVYYSLKSNVDAAVNFEGVHSLSGVTVDASRVSSRVLEVAIPAGTTAAQWSQIDRAIHYGQAQGVTVKITVIKP